MQSPLKICIAVPSLEERHAIKKLLAAAPYELHFLDYEKLDDTPFSCDIFIADHVLFSDKDLGLQQILDAHCPKALRLCIESSSDAVPILENLADWTISYNSLPTEILTAIKVLQVIERKVGLRINFSELLALCMKVSHDARNALAVAVGAAGRLGKIPEMAENSFFKMLLESHKNLVIQLNHLAFLHEKYSSTENIDKKDAS